MSDSKAMPYCAYGDPAEMVDRLRAVERKMSGCQKCGNCAGRLWGGDVCNLGLAPDGDGYCESWRERV